MPHTLLEALSPRTSPAGGRRRTQPSLETTLFLDKFNEESTPTEIVAAFKQAETRELQAIKELRLVSHSGI